MGLDQDGLGAFWLAGVWLAGKSALRQFPVMVRNRRRTRRGWLASTRDITIAISMIFLLALVVARLQQGQIETLQGEVRVVDGDSLTFASRRLRLNGIDAPELRQQCMVNKAPTACGRSAADYLRSLVVGQTVTCVLEGTDRYGRHLVECRNDDVAINQEMVRSGWAVAYGDYHSAEAHARAERAGIWAGEFATPAQWRRVHKGRDEQIHSSVNGVWPFLRRLFSVR